MRKTKFLLALVFLWLSPAYSDFSEEGVTGQFRAMVQNPTHGGGDFATFVTKPFIQDPTQDKAFFSRPTQTQWKKRYTDYDRTARNIAALEIFKIIGTSFRGIITDTYKKALEPLVQAQKDGLFNIIGGSLGFQNRPATPAEKAIMARELLNLGRFMGR